MNEFIRFIAIMSYITIITLVFGIIAGLIADKTFYRLKIAHTKEEQEKRKPFDQCA